MLTQRFQGFFDQRLWQSPVELLPHLDSPSVTSTVGYPSQSHGYF
jgi:hypothetical protein